jgi:5-carboxymethyl-2-hydroxymuconate isomerase
MPHIIVEHSANIADAIDLPGLMKTLHKEAIATGVFPYGGTRTRAARRDTYFIADEHPDNGFIHIILKIGHGRDQATKEKVGETLFKVVTDHLDAYYKDHPLAISMEIVEIDPVLTYKQNNIHDYVTRRQAAAGKEAAQ